MNQIMEISSCSFLCTISPRLQTTTVLSEQMAQTNDKNTIITSHRLYILVFGFGFHSSIFNWARSMRQACIGFALVCLVLTLHILSPKSLHKG